MNQDSRPLHSSSLIARRLRLPIPRRRFEAIEFFERQTQIWRLRLLGRYLNYRVQLPAGNWRAMRKWGAYEARVYQYERKSKSRRRMRLAKFF